MPFDSRKQQQWYHATGQTYLDDEPETAKKVKGEGEDPEFKDLTTTAGGDLDPQNKNLQTTQGSMKESLIFEGKEYKLSPEGHIPKDDDLEHEDKIYTEVTEEEKSLKRDQRTELASEYTYKEMRESLLKNDVKQIISKAVEEFKEDDHPRDGGKFTTKGGGATKQKEKPKPSKNFNKTMKDKPLPPITEDDELKQYGEKITDTIKTKGKGKSEMSGVDLLRYQSILQNKADSKDAYKDYEINDREKGKTSWGFDGANKRFLVKALGLNKNSFSKQFAMMDNEDQVKLIEYGKHAVEVLAKEEGLASVSGPPADSTMRVMSNKVLVRKDEENLTAEDDLTSEDLTSDKLGIEFEGEAYTLSPRGYNPKDKDLIFEGKIYKATEGGQYVCDTCGNKSDTEEQAKQHMAENEFREGHNRFTNKATEGIGNCQFCAGKGQVTVENLGIKDCPDCDGTGEIQQSNLAPDITGQVDPSLQPPQQPTQEVPQTPQPDQPTQQGQIPQQPMPNEQQAPPQQAPEEKEFPPKEEKPKFGEAKVSEGGVGSGRKSEGGKDDMRNWLESSGIIGPDDEVKQHHEDYYNKQMQATKEELKKKEVGEVKIIACEKSMKQYRGYIAREIKILKKRAKANEAVSIMYGLPTISKQGKKIKGILAYAGVSLNDRIYLPEELAKGHGLTLPLLLNHSNIAGAEEELDRLDDDMVNHLENEKDYKIGEVTLEWDQEKLTLFYEGVIDHPFFQKEVDDADMAVSLGIYYDSDSPVVCDENCYTIIKGAEFREVSLVYHPGFPIATIEAVENELKEEIFAKQKAKEDHLEKLEQLKKNEEEEQTKGEDETEDIKLVSDVIEDVKEGEEYEHTGKHTEISKAIQRDSPEIDKDRAMKIANSQIHKYGLEGEKEETVENEEEIIVTDDPETLDLVTQIPAEDWNEPIGNEVAIGSNFSIRGINGFTISNSNGVTRYKLDPSNGYENNWLHVNVNKEGAKLYGDEFQLQPKMTTPPELTKEIESHPDLKITDADADAFNPKKKVKAQDNFLE